MDNPKVGIKDTNSIGKGVTALENIKKDEIIADWQDGTIYEAEKASSLPPEVKDYAIQIEEHKWIDTNGIARFFNHSCEPNCGIKDKIQLVALRDIKKGEWLTFDYELTEDSDWIMPCKCECGSEDCRKTIGAFKNLPNEIREKYKGYISDWLVKKYKLS